ERRAERFIARTTRVDTRTGDAFEEIVETFGDALELGGLRVGAEHVRGFLGDTRLVVELVVRNVDGARRLSQRFCDRAERIRIAVRQADAVEHVRAEVACRDVSELDREPALADA